MRTGTKGWECPHPHCNMSSNREWNVIRHLGRAHNGLGMPLNKDDFTSKMYKESASQEPSLSDIAIASSIAAASLSSTQKHEKKHDPLDHALAPLRKLAEFKDLISKLFPRSQGIPVSSSYAAYNRFNAFGNPAYSQSFCFNDIQLEIFGYQGYTCRNCLTNHVLAEYTWKQPQLSQQQQQLIPKTHMCNSQRLIFCSSLPAKNKSEMIVNLDSILPKSIMKAVNDWTKSSACLLSFEIPYNLQKGYYTDLFPNHENHWSNLAIKNRQTVFNNPEELIDFICTANNATFGLFNVHSLSGQKDSKSTYFLFVSRIDPQTPAIKKLLLR